MDIDFKGAFEAIAMAAGVVQTAANTPGINVIPYANLVGSAAGLLQRAINLGLNITPYIEAIKDTYSGGVPSQEKQDALDAKLAQLRAEIQAPLPPPEEGEED
jgi:hypothetical protein